MTKFMLGVAVGYVFSDIIDDLIGKSQTFSEKVSEKVHTPPVTYHPEPPTEPEKPTTPMPPAPGPQP